MCKGPCQHPGAPCPWCRDWHGRTPSGLGNVCSQPSSMSRWGALAKREQCLALMFWDATAYGLAPSPPLPGHKSSGTEAGLSLRACVGVLVLAWRRRQSYCKHTTGKLQGFFSALVFMILPTKRSPFIKCECSHFYSCQILQLGELDSSSVSLFLVIKPNLDTSIQYLQRGFRWFCGSDVAGPDAWC